MTVPWRLTRSDGPPGEATGVVQPALVSLVRVAVAAAAIVPIGLYLFVALRRIGYPFELEWLEGGAVEIVQRVVHGQGIYVRPSLHFVSYPYPPLYFWVSAAVAKVIGVGFLPLRLVSLLSSVGCFAVLFHVVRRETGDPVAGIVSAGLFAATYDVSNAWFDVGRVDSLFLLLLLATVAVARRAVTAPDGALVGALLFLSFFTKQTALLAGMPMLLYLVVARRRAGAVALATLALLVGFSTAVLDALTARLVRLFRLCGARAPGHQPQGDPHVRLDQPAAPDGVGRRPRRGWCGARMAAGFVRALGVLGRRVPRAWSARRGCR